MTSPIKQSIEKPIELVGTNCSINPSVSLANFTSYRVGGAARWFVEPSCWDDIQAIFEWADRQQLPLTYLGAGSNLLISDRGISGLVVHTRKLRHCQFEREENSVRVGAGYSLPKLSWQFAKRGCQGLEWAVGIPGTIGGAVVMNAGAHQGCMADLLESVLVAYPDGKLRELPARELNYAYRSSSLQGQDILVLEARLRLKGNKSRQELMQLTTENFQHRKSTQPYDKPSCGSVFRNPKPQAAGWLIEQTGLKGYQIGGAQVSPLHANFIVNCGNATACDIFSLIHHVRERVEDHWSILLQPEVKLLGQF